MKTLIQSNTLGVVKNTIGVAALLLLAVLDTGQQAQAQTLLLQLKASNYNPTTGFWTNSVGPNAQAITPYPTLTAHATTNGSPAVVFNGANPMTLASSLSDGGNGFTVFAYTKPAAGGAAYALLGGANGSFEYRIYNTKQDALRQSTQDLGSETTALSTTAFSLIDATASTSGGAFRLNGVADGTSSAASANFSPPISAIGGRTGTSGGGENFSGSISEIDIYSGILSPASIANVEAQLTASYITTGPTLIIGLASVSPTNTVDAGSFVTLSAPVTGATNTTTFRWQTDNGTGGSSFANISGATTTNYVLDTTHLADSGPTTYEYQLIGTPASGISVTSAPVSLTVSYASQPTVSVDTTPNPANGTIGGNFTFSASFTGTLPIQYQWQVSPDGGNTVTNIAGATNTTLVLNNLQLSQNGLYYSLLATNTISSYVASSSWVPLNVQALTPLVQLIATNYDPIGGVWYDSSPNGNNAYFGPLVGSPALPTLAPFVTPNGASAVNITASGGSFQLPPPGLDFSSGYTVVAFVMPSIVSSGGARFALTGGSASHALEYDFYQGKQNYLMEFIGGGGSGNATISTNSFSLVDLAVNSSGAAFRLNGAADGSGPGSALSQNLTRIGNNEGGGDSFLGQIAEIDIYSGVLSSLQISNIEAQLTSNYVSVAGITIGAASVSPTNNTFAGNPIILFAPELGGTGTTSYRWQTDNGTYNNTGIATWANISGATSTNYVLNTAGLANSGTGPITYEYQLIGTPLGGLSVTGALVTLTVQPPSSPQLVSDTAPVTGTVGGNATFSAGFVGNLPIGYQWQVSPDQVAVTNIAGATNSTLVLGNLLITQNNLYYRLVATNAVAPYVSDSSWNQLTVEPLTPLVQFVATNYNPSSGVWTDSSPNNNTASYAGFNGATVPLPTLLSGVTPNGGAAVNISNGGGLFSLATPLDPSSGYTIFAYVMPSVVNGSRYALTGGNGAGATTGALQYGFYGGHQNYLNEYVGSEQASGTANISTSTFSLIDLAVNASGVSFRLNLVPDGTAGGATFPSPIAQIGNNQGGGDGFVGDIAEIDIYGGVLSASQIKNIESQLVADYGISAANLPKVTTTVTSHSLKLAWPADHTGWTLEAQTNSAHAGIGTNWVPVASSTTTNSIVIPIVPGNANVFYRLQY